MELDNLTAIPDLSDPAAFRTVDERKAAEREFLRRLYELFHRLLAKYGKFEDSVVTLNQLHDERLNELTARTVQGDGRS
ncbi:MAG: hypothetical protein O3A46_02905 [Candidatus Poribacteria bacterium]|nr:hypothetical protein [Candidatus Poribacteria bacterium]